MILEAATRVLCCHAHPDDETLSTGALLAHLHDVGIPADVLTATRGEMGETTEGPWRDLFGTDELTSVREGELRAAIAELGVENHYFLGTAPARVAGREPRRYRDSGMQWVTPEVAGPADATDERAFSVSPLDEQVDDLCALLDAAAADGRPYDLLVSYDAAGGYGHPDHVRMHEVVHAAAQRTSTPVAEVRGEKGPGVEWFELAYDLPRVQAALRRHATQLTLQPDGTTIVHVGGQTQDVMSTIMSFGLARSSDEQPTPTDALATIAADPDWWRQAVVYQIYPRSFADANGDGIGDLQGIRSRIKHLVELGVDAVWMSPFYPSPLADGGYDVVDHRDVDPRIGTLADFDELVADLHGNGIRLLVDIVPNHSSDEHPWFVEALASAPGSPARERYHFRDGSGPDSTQPPSDWTSLFGGSAWTRVEGHDGERAQWYLHTFATEQPDLNWANPEVRAHFLDVLRFWADRGVDGFRVDAAHMLAKDLADELPTQAQLLELPMDGNHPLADRDELAEIYGEWRQVFDSYDPPRTAVAEASVASERVPRYASPETLGQSFFFDLLLAEYDAAVFHAVVDECLQVAARSGSSVTWTLNNHDTIRTASRYGTPFPGLDHTGFPLRKYGGDWLLAGGDPTMLDAAQGLRRARAAALFMLALPGSAYIYQGEELGLQEVAEIADHQRQDPSFFRNRSVEVGRDGCRVPIPWTRGGPSYGFGAAGSHLPQPLWFGHYSVQAQHGVDDSTLTLYQRALRIRRALGAAESLEWVPSEDATVLHFVRPGGWQVVSNFGTTPVPLPTGDVLLSSGPVNKELPGETTVWLRVR